VKLWIPDRVAHDAVGDLPDGVEVGFIPRLVNAARGPIVDTRALLELLQEGHIRAALDVTDPEPLPHEHPLWDAPGLLITPHFAGDTPPADRRAFELVGDQVRRFVRQEPLANVVEHGY
jgi:phosphoglycerate dehydrogenase-like enzyme